MIRDFLVNRARAFIYATAPSPLVAAAVRAALGYAARSRSAARNCISLIAFTRERTQVQDAAFDAVRIADPADHRRRPIPARLRWHRRCKARGYDIRAIRPPTVPEGTARLRLTVTLNTEETVISQLISDLAAAQAEIAA